MENYTLEIKPKSKLLDLNLKETWKYRDLLFLFVRRDFVAIYKQTVLGPLWFFIQPILTSLMQLVIFNNIAKIPVDGMPPLVFYLSGNVMWQYFSSCLTLTSNTFRGNAGIFGKVYFPRVITPLSMVISQLLKFGVQLSLFLAVWGYFMIIGGTEVNLIPSWHIVLLPVLIIIMAGLGLGAGMLISALTTKYRDFTFLLTFAVQLMMYATPVIYPLSFVEGKMKQIIMLNPMTGIVETFRYGFTGAGTFSWELLGYSIVFMAVLMFLGTVVFNKVEKTFMDTV
ncbi:ABC transporter permease [Carboxylicivirga caseinilyticus]|uniref:ABC transporter permease n=1 Tax=Carboxylicivirga caseinilyticus TaxID=3417572 RepID=UPI003D34B9EE|nr:ABC transporter permease [Marinilabiliaceae bacterium A049]